MAEHNTYDHILKQRLNQLVAPDMESMWVDMHGILDREMPQEDKGKGFFGWLYIRKNLYLVVAFLLLSGTVTYFTISRFENKITFGNEEHVTIDQDAGIVAQENTPEENKTATTGINDVDIAGDRKKSNNISEVSSKQTTALAERAVKVEDKFELNNENNLEILDGQVAEYRDLEVEKEKDFQLQIPSKRLVAMIERKSAKLPSVKITTLRRVGLDRNDLKVASNNNLVPTINTSVKDENSELRSEVSNEIANETRLGHSIAFTGIKRINDAVSLIIAEPVGEKKTLGIKVPLAEADMVVKKAPRNSRNIFIAGLSVNYHMPVSGQELSTITGAGSSNQLLDYLPSAYVQYYISEKWFVQAELQYKAPQYVEPIKTQSKFTPVNANKKYEEWSTLSKLYYMNLPVSIHYKISDKFSVGTGVQYSYLRSSIIETNKCSWENSSNGWEKSYTSSKIHVRKNPKKENNDNGSGTTPATMTQVDTLAQGIRGNDWRVMFDVNYKWKNITGGIKFTAGLNNYIQLHTDGVSSELKDKNQAVQLYLRYDLFNSSRKRKH